MGIRRWKDIAESLRSLTGKSSALRATSEDIRFAYRLLLGREPDEAGWKAFLPLLKSRRLAPQEIASAILGSDEFLHSSGEHQKYIEVTLRGRTMFVPSDDRDIGRAIVDHQRYEPSVEIVLRKILHPGACFIDVGANVGYFALLAASLVGPTGKVYAVEPMDKNLQCLYAAALRNGFTQLCIYPYAAAASAQILSFTTDAGTSNAHASALTGAGEFDAVRVPAIALDDLLSDVSQVDLIKLDVEGMEPQAWRGMEQLLSRCRPRIVIEFHPNALRQAGTVNPEAFLDTLFAYGAVSVLRDDRSPMLCSMPGQILVQFESADTNGSITHLNLLLEP